MTKASRKNKYIGISQPKGKSPNPNTKLLNFIDFAPHVRAKILSDGSTLYSLIFPFPTERGKDEWKFDLHFCLDFPLIAEAVSYACLDIVARRSHSTQATIISNLGMFFFFLKSTRDKIENNQFDLKDFNSPLINEYINWLDTHPSKLGKATKETGRRKRLDCVRSLVRALQKGRWASRINPNLDIRGGVWPGSDRKSNPTAVIEIDELSRIYRACLVEIEHQKSMVERGLTLIKQYRSITLEYPHDIQSYRDLGARLASIDCLFSGMIPEEKDFGKLSDPQKTLIRSLKLYGGKIAHARYFYPGPRNLVPFVVLLAIHTEYNPDTILTLERRRIRTSSILTTQRISFENDAANAIDQSEEERLVVSAPKGRARGRPQQRSFIVSDDADNPAQVLKFLDFWTARIRPFAPPLLSDRVFLFVPDSTNHAVTSFGYNAKSASSRRNWQWGLGNFIAEHDLQSFTLRQIRATLLDVAHQRYRGDIRAILALGRQQSPHVIASSYTSSGARLRNDERLGAAAALMARDRATGSRADARRGSEMGADPGAATPGWNCLDPFDSPVAGQKRGRACTAFGQCPACPLAQLDTGSPISARHAFELLARIDEARRALDAAEWLTTWAPVRARLYDYWLPQFHSRIRQIAAQLDLRPFPSVV